MENKLIMRLCDLCIKHNLSHVVEFNKRGDGKCCLRLFEDKVLILTSPFGKLNTLVEQAIDIIEKRYVTNNLRNVIRTIAHENFKTPLEELTLDSVIKELSSDSIRIVEFYIDIDKRFCTITPTQFCESDKTDHYFNTLGDVYNWLLLKSEIAKDMVKHH